MSEACEICGKPSSVQAQGGSFNGVKIPEDRWYRFCMVCAQDSAKLRRWLVAHA